MIIAEIYTQNDGKIVAFVLRGHSDGGKKIPGYNVHCAEASALSQSAYLGIRSYLNREVAAENFEHGGLGVELKDAPDDLTEAIFQTMLIGLKAVEKTSPKSLRVAIIEMNDLTRENLQYKIDSMTQSPGNELPKVNVDKVKIRAEIYRNDSENTIGFLIEERKTTVDEFKIYRAGIWSLVNSAFSGIKDFLKREVKFDKNPRRLKLKLKTPPDAVTEAVFQTMLIGLREIEKRVPQVIRVEEKLPLGGEIQ